MQLRLERLGRGLIGAVAGAIIVRDLLRQAKAAEMLVSDRGVRFGLIEDLLASMGS